MDREKAFDLVKKYIKNKNLIKHSLAVEAIMKEIAKELNNVKSKSKGKKLCDEKKWAIAGLVHDIDYESTAKDPKNHSLIGAEILKKNNFEEDIIYAVKVHNQIHNLPLQSKLDIALFAADPLSGLIVASVLINPEKKIKEIDSQFVLNRFKEKSFARGADRNQILACERIGFTLKEFIEIALISMQKIDKDLGL